MRYIGKWLICLTFSSVDFLKRELLISVHKRSVMQEMEANKPNSEAENGHLSAPRKPLRVWPGVAAVAALCVLWLVPFVVRDAAMITMMGGLACGLIILVWWLFFSR